MLDCDVKNSFKGQYLIRKAFVPFQKQLVQYPNIHFLLNIQQPNIKKKLFQLTVLRNEHMTTNGTLFYVGRDLSFYAYAYKCRQHLRQKRSHFAFAEIFILRSPLLIVKSSS